MQNEAEANLHQVPNRIGWQQTICHLQFRLIQVLITTFSMNHFSNQFSSLQEITTQVSMIMEINNIES